MSLTPHGKGTTPFHQHRLGTSEAVYSETKPLKNAVVQTLTMDLAKVYD